jgi:hypothetical protein
MLKKRRVLEMGSRIHWYLLFSTLGLFIFYLACLNFEVSSEYCDVFAGFLRMMIMLSLVFGIWLFIFCFSLFFRDKMFPWRAFIGNSVRILMVLIVDLGFSTISHIAGKSFLIF